MGNFTQEPLRLTAQMTTAIVPFVVFSHGGVAQMVEHAAHIRSVKGSSPLAAKRPAPRRGLSFSQRSANRVPLMRGKMHPELLQVFHLAFHDHAGELTRMDVSELYRARYFDGSQRLVQIAADAQEIRPVAQEIKSLLRLDPSPRIVLAGSLASFSTVLHKVRLPGAALAWQLPRLR